MRNQYLIYILLFFTLPVASQSYYDGLPADKATVTTSDQTVTVYLLPLRSDIEADPGKYYHWYRANQISRTQGGYSGKLLNGPYVAFYPNKNLKERGEFKNGLQRGEWRAWHESGALKEIVKWRSGMRTGRFEEYNAKGALVKKGRYKQDKLHGGVVTYSSQDSSQVLRYSNGKPVVKANKGSSSNLKSKVKGVTSRLLKKKERKPDDSADTKRKSRKRKAEKLNEIPVN